MSASQAEPPKGGDRADRTTKMTTKRKSRPSPKPGTPNQPTLPHMVEHEDRDYTIIKVLILFFEYNDLGIAGETAKVEEAFDRLKYRVRTFEIPMVDSTTKLEERLNEFLEVKDESKANSTLHIIYYDGHGGFDETEDGVKQSLDFFSHNQPTEAHLLMKEMTEFWKTEPVLEGEKFHAHLKQRRSPFQPVAMVSWPDISPTILKANSDTLIILDCCNAGLAAATSQKPEALNDLLRKYPTERRKELIGACGWEIETGYHLAPALCTVLKNRLPTGGSDMSTFTLVRDMNNELVGKSKGSAPQAVHYILQSNPNSKMILSNLQED
ncbi:hypothetical protein CC80DRAFT_508321 [Byssothecium circinans]|uniref:Peptidase C14 n=1 Tax=Byssothecium circinans TaxID=147558 RepID=A0A6A5TJW9_9PLEO|nr:hypothetical protein CC80DRAFT_508321 [Byssothecium circinans]